MRAERERCTQAADSPVAVAMAAIAGSGVAGFADGDGASAAFNHPWDLDVSPAGVVYVADKVSRARARVWVE